MTFKAGWEERLAAVYEFIVTEFQRVGYVQTDDEISEASQKNWDAMLRKHNMLSQSADAVARDGE